MRVEGRVGVGKFGDDTLTAPRLGSQGELIVSDMNGLFYEQTMRGNAFMYSTTSAVSVTALATTGAPNIWNPAGSGKNLVITKVTFGMAAIGTPAISSFVYGILRNAGNQIGTAAPVVSLTQVDPVNLLIGGGNVSVMRFAPATISLTTAPTILCNSGCSTGSAAAPVGYNFQDDVNGRIILAPGSLLQVGATVATSTTFIVSIYGFELPIPLSA